MILVGLVLVQFGSRWVVLVLVLVLVLVRVGGSLCPRLGRGEWNIHQHGCMRSTHDQSSAESR